MCKAAAVLSFCKNVEVRKFFRSLMKAMNFFFRRFVHRYTQKNVLNNHRGPWILCCHCWNFKESAVDSFLGFEWTQLLSSFFLPPPLTVCYGFSFQVMKIDLSMGSFWFLKQGHMMQFRLALNSQSSHFNLYSARSPSVCCHAWLTDECGSLPHKNTRILLENTFNFSIKIISV